MSVVARTISSPYRNENGSVTESDNMECYNDAQAGPSSSLEDSLMPKYHVLVAGISSVHDLGRL
jgi:hypothetical protein